ncbi:hypothetical protein GQ53DRAFT_872691 [Thozetella sp. PMI_491]|nr:hypothetical protein GQ53DRAFT_872691 [Thozetella sp. PMI_491]
MAPYTYVELKDEEIRLLRLMPGQWDDEISLDIFHIWLHRPESEQTETRTNRLSLVRETINGEYLFHPSLDELAASWDHPDPNFDGALHKLRPKKAYAGFQPNYEALSYVWGLLRHSSHPRTLWVDSLCINQDDIFEPNRQVLRMRDVYSLAQRTLIWLGEESDDSAHALHTINHFGHQVEVIKDGRLFPSPGSSYPEWHMAGSSLPYERTWSCLADLFRRPWFSRVWFLQESMLGNFVPWAYFRKAMLVLGRKLAPGILPDSLRGVSELLTWARARQCADPRDKVYGILSLVPLSMARSIKPDYSIGTYQTYMSTLLAYISATKRLDILQLQASGLSMAQVRYIAPNGLEVFGVKCASISTVCVVSANVTSEGILKIISQWGLHSIQEEDYITGGPFLDALLETIFQGQIRDRYPEFDFPSLETLRHVYLNIIGKNALNPEMAPKTYQKFGRMSIFRTFEGYLGVSPLGIEENDHIFVILGSPFPIILRQTELGKHLVVCHCLLGPLLASWRTELRRTGSGFSTYFISREGTITLNDPLLENNRFDPVTPISFRNLATGETRDLDPRLLPEISVQRGA